MTHRIPNPAHITGWDRAAIVALGAAGCALSYDALVQMAAAIHVRGPLTYLFPLVIDGFIAYGVRALLVLRAAPLAARCYVWLLFGTATAASIWANALHAIRLNQQTHPATDGLRLDDLTVGALSAIAPLALAGAVHLYLHIHRHPGGTRPSQAAATSSALSTTARSKSREVHPSPARGPKRSAGSGDGVAESTMRRKGRRPEINNEALLAIARTAPLGRDGRVSRRAVEQAVRAAGHSVAKDRAADITQQLQAEHDHAEAELASAP
jgi:hypothetical protein